MGCFQTKWDEMDIKEFGKQPVKLQSEKKAPGTSFSPIKGIPSPLKKPVKKPFGHFMKRPNEKKERTEKLPPPFGFFSPPKQQLKLCIKQEALQAVSLEVSPSLSQAVCPSEQTPSVFVKSDAYVALVALAQKMCEKIAVIEKEGVAQISLPLKVPSFQGVTLQVTLHSTAPRQYNVEFFGCTPAQQAQLTDKQALTCLYGQAEQAGFQIHQLYAIQEPQEVFAAAPYSEDEGYSQEEEHPQKEQE